MSKSSPKDSLNSPKMHLEPSPISAPVSDFGIRPLPMLLSVEFSGGVLPARLAGMKYARLADIHKQYVVWGKAKGLSNEYVAKVLGCDSETVSNFLKKLRREEGILYDVGVIQRIGTGKYGRAVRYFCRVCGETFMVLRPAADHTFYHVFPDGGGLLIPQKVAQERERQRNMRDLSELRALGQIGHEFRPSKSGR